VWQMFGLIALAMCLSCSPPSTPVQESVLVGRWQQVDKPAIMMTFLKDRTFSANVAGQRLLGGQYQLIDGGRLVLDCDASSAKAGRVTNTVFMAGEELRIKAADGTMERYKRVK
jgi:hypothetical protein